MFGKPFHDTFWQTETGCIMITNFPGMKVKPGSMGKPFRELQGWCLIRKNMNPLQSRGK